MPTFPWTLSLEYYDVESGVITADAAVDILNKQVILKDNPKVNLPQGGRLEITQRIDYSYGQETNEDVVALLQSAFYGVTDGIRELVIKDESIPDSDLAHTRAVNELDKVDDRPYTLSFETTTGGWQVGQVIRLTDTVASVDVYLMVTNLNIRIDNSSVTDTAITTQVTASTLPPETIGSVIAAGIRRAFRPIQRAPITADVT